MTAPLVLTFWARREILLCVIIVISGEREGGRERGGEREREEDREFKRERRGRNKTRKCKLQWLTYSSELMGLEFVSCGVWGSLPAGWDGGWGEGEFDVKWKITCTETESNKDGNYNFSQFALILRLLTLRQRHRFFLLFSKVTSCYLRRLKIHTPSWQTFLRLKIHHRDKHSLGWKYTIVTNIP